MFVWMDERMDGRFVVGDMSTLVTLTILSPFSPHRYPYLSHPPLLPNPTNLHRQSVIDDHIIQYPYTIHPGIPTCKED